MSKAEIIAELPPLKSQERAEVFEKLCELQDDDILRGAPPSAAEQKILDHALTEFRRDGNLGSPWREVIKRLKSDRPA